MDNGIDIGERLQILRSLNGFSQRELAKRAQVTNSTISLIEQGRVSPSVSSLQKVLAGFPMSLAEFFEPNLLDTIKSFYREDDMPDVGLNGYPSLLLGCMRSRRDFSITVDTYRPGIDTGTIDEEHPGEQGGILVEGELEVAVGSEVCLLTKGQGYFFSRNRPHRFRNRGESDAVVVTTRSGDINPNGQ